MLVKFKIPGTQSLAWNKSHILTGLPGPKCTSHSMSFLALHPQHFLEQRQSPEAGEITGKSWSKAMGGSRELTISTWTEMNMIILR